MNDERGTNYLLISLLRILANMHGKCSSSYTFFTVFTTHAYDVTFIGQCAFHCNFFNDFATQLSTTL